MGALLPEDYCEECSEFPCACKADPVSLRIEVLEQENAELRSVIDKVYTYAVEVECLVDEISIDWVLEALSIFATKENK